MSELLTPAEVEAEMIDLNRRVGDAPKVIREYHNNVRAARKAYKRAWALAYSSHPGTINDRKAHAELVTEDERDALDIAEVEYKHVIDTLDSLRTKLRALQSISSLMKASMFGPQGGI